MGKACRDEVYRINEVKSDNAEENPARYGFKRKLPNAESVNLHQ